VQKFTDPALTQCDRCDGALRKVYNAVGVVFKGSGFYRTDSRASTSEAKSNGKKGEKASTGASSTSSSESSSTGSAGGGSETKPATASSTAA
jgi:predicted nucleic acid-binding Zn ribbon protein